MTAVTLRAWLMLVCSGYVCAAHASETLYTRLGGATGVRTISDTLIDRVVADPLTGPSFKDTNVGRIKRLLAEQICDLSGGPCHYSGDSMKEVHAGQHISEAQFYAMVATLKDVLKEQRVALGARNELLRLLAPMKRDVVEHAATTAGAAKRAPPP
jgi:hemoglobin